MGEELEEPQLVKVRVGWAAVGDGWAVYASTRKEAERLFRAAVRSQQRQRERENARVEEELTEGCPRRSE